MVEEETGPTHFQRLAQVLSNLDDGAVVRFANSLKVASDASRVFVCGNGGSSAMCSHAAADMAKALKYPGFLNCSFVCLTDSVPLLTAMANDHSYDEVFVRAMKVNNFSYRDYLLVVSSSGNSQNVVSAVDYACSITEPTTNVFAFTGFDWDNRVNTMLRSERSDENIFHVSSMEYGVVEDVHAAAFHRVVELVRSK